MPRLSIPAALVGAALLAGLVFGLDPALDLQTAALFYDGNGTFIGGSGLGQALRRIFYWIPTVTLLVYLGLYAARRLGTRRAWAPTGRGVIFLLLTLAIGPGLMANSVLKEHSHRPRPSQTTTFGGDETFRPFYAFDGGCKRNCSFVSGEGATSAWTLGAALLVPPPWRGVAVAASLLFALGTGLLRLAFGGHYLSDAVFAVLISWIVLWIGWAALRPRMERRKDRP